MKTLARLAVACVFLALHAAAAHALEPVRHDGWTFGMEYGFGHAEITAPDGETFYAKDGVFPGIVIQHSLSSRVRAGVTWADWLIERGIGGERIRFSMQTLTASLTVAPGNMENAWSGLYLRAGAGVATGRFSTAGADEHGEDANLDAHDQTGFGVHGGIGYEFMATRHIAIGGLVSGNYASYNDDLFDNGWFVPVSMTLHFTF